MVDKISPYTNFVSAAVRANSPRSVWLEKGKGRSFRTSCFLESGTADCLLFSNLASS